MFFLCFVVFLFAGCFGDQPKTPKSLTIPPSDLTVSVIGMGVISLESFPDKVQALIMGKRAAVNDGYRQIGERIYGIKLNAKDTVRDAIAKDSTIKSCVSAWIRNASIEKTVCEERLCQVEMSVKLDQTVFQELFPWKE